jgi:nicotinamidase-related amidase
MKSCLIVIDVQESFRHKPFFSERHLADYLAAQNALIAGAKSQAIPIVRVLHVNPAPDNSSFALSSGHVRPLHGLLDFEPALTVHKSRHSALVGTGLDVWLTEQQMGRLIISGIRTEQCCETTTRHASDLGWTVDYCLDATLTFDMTQLDGSTLSANDIKTRTATVLQGRFARICSVDQALAGRG